MTMSSLIGIPLVMKYYALDEALLLTWNSLMIISTTNETPLGKPPPLAEGDAIVFHTDYKPNAPPPCLPFCRHC
jgi:hypothetical protein